MKRGYWVAMLPFYLLVMIIFIGVAKGGSDAVNAINDKQPLKRVHTIIIDAGHGGVDGGATSCTGVLESTINLQFSLRLNDLLQFLGYDTKMVRTTDTSVYTQGNTIGEKKISDLKERVRMVNETAGGILISIHQNTFPSSIYGGPQVFYKDSLLSKELAVKLQTMLNKAISPNSKRQCKKANGIFLMEQIEKEGVLIECGFLTNPQEENKLRDETYQKSFCCVIAAVISDYLNA